jgi:hypothetical protein
MDIRLLNGNPKCTLIQRFDNHVVVLTSGKKNKKQVFNSMDKAKLFVHGNNYEVNVEHIHPGQNSGIVERVNYGRKGVK